MDRRDDDKRNAPAQVVWQGKYQRMMVRGTWEYVERAHAGGLAAIIIAVTPDDEGLFGGQVRVPLPANCRATEPPPQPEPMITTS